MEDLKLDLKYKVMIHVGRPVGEVFEAVADPKQLSSYFTTGGASGAAGGGHDGDVGFRRLSRRLPGRGRRSRCKDQKIVLRWEANDPEAPTPDKLDRAR